MTRLLRFSVQQAVVDINRNDDGHHEVEIHGAKTPEHEKSIRDYLVSEGIFESILFGKLDFPDQSAENLLLHPELAPQSLL